MTQRPYQVLVAGHVCLDIIPEIAKEIQFRPGTLTEVGKANLAPGGAVSNVGTVLARLGIRTAMVCKVGDDAFANTLDELLGRNAPSASRFVKRDSAEVTSYTIVINSAGSDRTFLHAPGANRSFRSSDVSDEDLRAAERIHFGYPPLMEAIFDNDGAELCELFRRAKSFGLQTSLDMSYPDRDSKSGRANWRQILENVLPVVDLFLPSIEEITVMLDPSTTQEELREDSITKKSHLEWVFAELKKLGSAECILKLGSAGLAFMESGSISRQPCFPVEVVGATGSGDATIAGILCGLSEGLAFKSAIEIGTVVGGCSCEALDAVSGVPDRAAVQNRLGEFTGNLDSDSTL